MGVERGGCQWVLSLHKGSLIVCRPGVVPGDNGAILGLLWDNDDIKGDVCYYQNRLIGSLGAIFRGLFNAHYIVIGFALIYAFLFLDNPVTWLNVPILLFLD